MVYFCDLNMQGIAKVDDELLENMRDRIDRCRRLASLNNDQRTSAALLEMAADGEDDLKRLEAKRPSNNL